MAAAAFLELEQILRSKQEKLTSQEANVLMRCRSKAFKELILGAGIAGGVTWLATPRLTHLFRISLAGGVAVISALLRFNQSLDSHVEHILGLQGTRMQKELANILLKRNPDDPIFMKSISKHFYSESVFDDSTSEKPRQRWHYRNFYFDSAVRPENTRDDDSHSDNTDLERNEVTMSSGFFPMTNPFDWIFGIPPSAIEVHHRSGFLTTSPSRQGRKHRRSQRKHQIRSQEVSSTSRPAVG